MRITEEDIKTVLVKMLEKADFNVISSDIDEGFNKPAVFVDVYPSGIEKECGGMETVTDTIEIEYHSAKETVQDCAEAAARIRSALFYKTVDVKDRHLTIEDITFDILGSSVLAVEFQLAYMQMRPDAEYDGDDMYELNLNME